MMIVDDDIQLRFSIMKVNDDFGVDNYWWLSIKIIKIIIVDDDNE